LNLTNSSVLATVSGRIAARFPGMNGELSERSQGSSSMMSYHSAAESLNTSGTSIGRGRGILSKYDFLFIIIFF